MKCFYHEEKDAVGQCQQCGKGLCKECFKEHGGVCDDCYFSNKADAIDGEHNDIYNQLLDYKQTLISSLIKGGIAGVIVAIIMIALGLGAGCIFFLFVPTGYMTLTKVFGKDPYAAEKNSIAIAAAFSSNDAVSGYGMGYLIAQLLLFMLKVFIGGIIGIPLTGWTIYKLVKTNKQIEELEQQYDATVEDFKEELKTKKN